MRARWTLYTYAQTLIALARADVPYTSARGVWGGMTIEINTSRIFTYVNSCDPV